MNPVHILLPIVELNTHLYPLLRLGMVELYSQSPYVFMV
jgi:hypothetical protein